MRRLPVGRNVWLVVCGGEWDDEFLTSVVSVEKRMLLVPLSNMILRDRDNREVVRPLTDTPGEERDQCESLVGRGANIGLPSNTRNN